MRRVQHLTTATIKEALRLPLAGLNVCIIGHPATGKTFFGGHLALCNPLHTLFKCDDYLKDHDGVQAMYACLGDVVEAIEAGKPTIVEGIAGYRMLRKGVELDSYYPDVVFEMIAPLEQIMRVYETDPLRSSKNAKNIAAFCKAQETIKAQYLANVPDDKAPNWIKIENIF